MSADLLVEEHPTEAPFLSHRSGTPGKHQRLATNVRNFRIRKGDSLEKFAQACNIESEYLQKIENGSAIPRTVVLKRIAEYLGCTVDELYS